MVFQVSSVNALKNYTKKVMKVVIKQPENHLNKYAHAELEMVKHATVVFNSNQL